MTLHYKHLERAEVKIQDGVGTPQASANKAADWRKGSAAKPAQYAHIPSPSDFRRGSDTSRLLLMMEGSEEDTDVEGEHGADTVLLATRPKMSKGAENACFPCS